MKRAVVLGVILCCDCTSLDQVAGSASQLNPKVPHHEACQNGTLLACKQSISEGLDYFQKGCQAGDKVKCSEYEGYVTDSKAERSPQVIDHRMFDQMSQ